MLQELSYELLPNNQATAKEILLHVKHTIKVQAQSYESNQYVKVQMHLQFHKLLAFLPTV